jgi:hypothetical protein
MGDSASGLRNSTSEGVGCPASHFSKSARSGAPGLITRSYHLLLSPTLIDALLSTHCRWHTRNQLTGGLVVVGDLAEGGCVSDHHGRAF